MIAILASGIHGRPPATAGASGAAVMLTMGIVVLVIFGGLALSEARRWLRDSPRRERFGWRLWTLAGRLPARCNICPSNSHTALVLTYPGRSRNLFVDEGCRRDAAANGSCYCNRIKAAEPAEVAS